MADMASPFVESIAAALSAGRVETVAIEQRVQGGAPGERRERSVTLTADGMVAVVIRDDLDPKNSGDGRARIPRGEAADLIARLARMSGELIPAERARFLPDAPVGSVRFTSGAQSETYYFEIDRDDPGAADTGGVLGQFDRLQSLAIRPAPTDGRPER